MKIVQAEFAGKPFDPYTARVSATSPMLEYETDYAYTVVLSRAG